MDNKDEKINIGTKEIKNIKMTSAEKNHIFENILNKPVPSAVPVRNPWSFFLFAPNYSPYLKFAVFLIVILAGGGIIISKNSSPKIAVPTIPNYYQTTNLIGNNSSNESPENKTQKEIENSNTKPKEITPVVALNQNTSNNTNASTSVGLATNLPPTYKNYSVDSENYINIASPVFTTYFDKLATERGDILDYKINNIIFMALKKTAEQPQKSWFSAKDSDEAFIVTVDFSVKTTEDGKKNFWLAGNGHDAPDGWVLNKSLFITIDKFNNIYFVTSAGTGM